MVGGRGMGVVGGRGRGVVIGCEVWGINMLVDGVLGHGRPK